jgi:hypothetical protein
MYVYVGVSVVNRKEECFSGLTLHTSEHPLLSHIVVPVSLAPTELAIVDSNVRTAYLLRPTQHVDQHGLSPELGPIFDGCGAKLML